MRTLASLVLLSVVACGGDPVPARDPSAEPVVAPSAAPSPSAAPATDAPNAPAAPSAVAPAPSASTPVTATAPSSSGEKVYDQTTKTIDAQAGDHFVVVVPGNATTAYTWRADPQPAGSVLAVDEPKYTPQPPPGCNKCLGYGGTYAFPVTAKAAGAGKLHLVKVHVGRVPGTPVQEVSVAVTVK